jgi:hypothetical protein
MLKYHNFNAIFGRTFLKNILIKTLTILSLVTTSNCAFAEKFSYDYVDVGYTHWDVKTSTSDLNYSGYAVKGIKEVSGNIHVFGEYMDIKKSEDNVDLAFKTFGMGLHQPLSIDTDIVIDIYKTNWNSVASASEGNFNSGEVKLRHNFSDDLELSVNYEKHSATIGYDGFSVGAIQKINNDLSVGLDYASLNSSDSTVDWSMTTLSLRRYY